MGSLLNFGWRSNNKEKAANNKMAPERPIKMPPGLPSNPPPAAQIRITNKITSTIKSKVINLAY